MSICSVVSSGSMSDIDGPCSSLTGAHSITSSASRKSGKSVSTTTSYKLSRQYCCRRSESILLMDKYPTKVPLIIERFKSEKRLRPLERCQFVLPAQATVGQLTHIIRTRVCDSHNMSVYVLVGNELPSLDVTMNELALRHCDGDGFTYLSYSSEDTLG
ncbi:Microtubule-associated proteins 1A/1B light chain 3C-like protein [Aphelenchoides bicaudatus]|nr:Microtubule-associated proteins 1A/1B light chain 3C-like protein [Aphelenchoides bicaudatus]